MKKALVCFSILAMLAMSSCLVSSLHPFYKAKDKIYDPAMVGSWNFETKLLTFLGDHRKKHDIQGFHGS